MMVYYVFTNEDIFHLKALHVAFSSGGCFPPRLETVTLTFTFCDSPSLRPARGRVRLRVPPKTFLAIFQTERALLCRSHTFLHSKQVFSRFSMCAQSPLRDFQAVPFSLPSASSTFGIVLRWPEIFFFFFDI